MKSITLEIGLKPFKKTDSEYIKNVCSTVFDQWRPLIKDAEEISILLWSSDGAEILEYGGDLDAEFDWERYLGCAAMPFLGENERHDTSLMEKKRLYMENPPVMTYRILKNISEAFRAEGEKRFPNSRIRIGTTFDIGPEFSYSVFKYELHPEILTGHFNEMKNMMIECTALLNGDSRKYAAYPDGIPDKTPFGTFFGKQTQKFFEDIGFDYIWLSNGLGFSSEPWDLVGKIYDGKKFYPERLEKTKKSVFEFWKYFREACPDYPIECRGTNNSVGIDYATDGVPLYDIYKGNFNITPPPNSPWAPLTGDYGLELMGHMSRIAEIPGEQFLFRYYIHDTWWVNSPWYDRYEGEPHDIYLPMSISRITPDGKIQSAERLSVFTLDNSYGEMPDSCVNEPVPHILKAIKDKSDAPAPFIWLYPVNEFTHSYTEEELSEMYFGDNFIRREINNGFPLNCVVSTDSFAKNSAEVYAGSVIIAPVAAAYSFSEKLSEFAKKGIAVIVYGSRKQLEKGNFGKFASTVDMENDTLFDAVRNCGYDIKWGECPYEVNIGDYARAMTVNRSDNAYMFSVCNKNTTVDCELSFPLGAPILLGCEAEIKDGHSIYRFPRSAHRECRIFVRQNEDSVISAREAPPTNETVKRRILVSGLRDATVYFFPETYCVKHALVGDSKHGGNITTAYFTDHEYVDSKYGTYLKCEHMTGDITFYMPEEKFFAYGEMR